MHQTGWPSASSPQITDGSSACAAAVGADVSARIKLSGRARRHAHDASIASRLTFT